MPFFRGWILPSTTETPPFSDQWNFFFKGVSFSLLPFSTSIRDPFWGEILFQSNETERAKGAERDIDFLPFAQV